VIKKSGRTDNGMNAVSMPDQVVKKTLLTRSKLLSVVDRGVTLLKRIL